MNNHQNAIFHQITNFLKTPLALLGVDLKNFQFNKICHFANHPYLCKGLSKLENKLNGSMKDKAPVKERLKIINWVKHGAEQQRWENEIQLIVLKRCASCHISIPALPNITKFEVIKGLAITDGAVDISSLTRISHIHLFGIAFIFFFVGLIFSLATGFNKWLKATVIFTPFAFLILDVSAWWLTRIDPAFAWLVIIGGFGYSLTSTIMISTSLYQMWIMPWRGKISHKNAWSNDSN